MGSDRSFYVPTFEKPSLFFTDMVQMIMKKPNPKGRLFLKIDL